MAKERLHYIDVAKGILILLVIYGHIYGASSSINHPLVEYIRQGANGFIAYYMPCFFVITGFCSNFEKPFMEFCIGSFKTIILPALFFSLLFFLLKRQFDVLSIKSIINSLLCYGGDYWFLSSLFLARLLYWLGAYHFSKKNLAFICVFMFLLGYLLNFYPHEYEFWWFVHAIILMPYLGIGQLLKHRENGIINKVYPIVFLFLLLHIATIYLAHIGVLQIDYFYHVPGITQMFLNLNASMFIPLLFLSLSGILMVLAVSKYIGENFVLEYIGKNSLTVYCVQGFVLSAVYSRIGGGISSEDNILEYIKY